MHRLLYALTGLLMAAALQAAPLRVDATADIYPLAHHATRFHDAQGKLSLEEVRELARDNQFTSLPGERSNFGYVDGAMWFRFALEGSGDVDATEPWLLSIEYPLLDHVTLYRIGPDGDVTS